MGACCDDCEKTGGCCAETKGAPVLRANPDRARGKHGAKAVAYQPMQAPTGEIVVLGVVRGGDVAEMAHLGLTPVGRRGSITEARKQTHRMGGTITPRVVYAARANPAPTHRGHEPTLTGDRHPARRGGAASNTTARKVGGAALVAAGTAGLLWWVWLKRAAATPAGR